jgi:hypothetical protein
MNRAERLAAARARRSARGGASGTPGGGSTPPAPVLHPSEDEDELLLLEQTGQVYGPPLLLDPYETPPRSWRKKVVQERPGHYDDRPAPRFVQGRLGFSVFVRAPLWENGVRRDGYYVTARPTDESARYAQRRVTLQLLGEPLLLPRMGMWRICDYEAGLRQPERDGYSWKLLEHVLMEALTCALRRLGTGRAVLEKLLRGGFRPEELNAAAGQQLLRFWRRDARYGSQEADR